MLPVSKKKKVKSSAFLQIRYRPLQMRDVCGRLLTVYKKQNQEVLTPPPQHRRRRTCGSTAASA
jgi:hypothetical protein